MPQHKGIVVSLFPIFFMDLLATILHILNGECNYSTADGFIQPWNQYHHVYLLQSE